jgi:hypothetical protein
MADDLRAERLTAEERVLWGSISDDPPNDRIVNGFHPITLDKTAWAFYGVRRDEPARCWK